MSALFVSHSSQDAEVTARYRDRLRHAGFDALFVDFDPLLGIPAGRAWERELYAQLRKADAVVFLATPASTASQWCGIEIGLARSLGKPVFPVMVAATERHPLLQDAQWVDATDDDESAFDRLLAGLHAAGLEAFDLFLAFSLSVLV